ncbi:MAG: hypothetical protein JOS17DRAFT_105357 [Linnemannia elongata]|nr:MAG: hypothetical protein JOS17DRAFT_105357 [Linnemannia elongata]
MNERVSFSFFSFSFGSKRDTRTLPFFFFPILFVLECSCFAGTQTYAYSSQFFLAYHGPFFLSFFCSFVLRNAHLHAMSLFSFTSLSTLSPFTTNIPRSYYSLPLANQLPHSLTIHHLYLYLTGTAEKTRCLNPFSLFFSSVLFVRSCLVP